MVVIDFDTFLPFGNSISAVNAAVVSPGGGVTWNVTRTSSPFLAKLMGAEAGSIFQPAGAVRWTVAVVTAVKFCSAMLTVFGCVSGNAITRESRFAVTS